MEGHENLIPDTSLLRELNLVLARRESHSRFSVEEFGHSLENITLAFFPLRTSLEREAPRFPLVYMGRPNARDPYMFYMKRGSDSWVMDCRLIDVATHLRSAIRRYGVSLFRRYYYRIYRDNEYREELFTTNALQGLKGRVLDTVSQLISFGGRSIISRTLDQGCQGC